MSELAHIDKYALRSTLELAKADNTHLRELLQDTKGRLVNLLTIIEGIDEVASDETCHECIRMDKKIDNLYRLIAEVDTELAKELADD